MRVCQLRPQEQEELEPLAPILFQVVRIYSSLSGIPADAGGQTRA